MKYLLDTCCISDFVKNEINTVRHLKYTSPATVAISSITVMELEYGLLHNPEKTKKLKSLIHALIASTTVLPYETEDAKLSAEIRAMMRKSGTPIGEYDVLIAGTALRHSLTLITSNEKEFRRIPGLKIENWRNE